MNIQEIVTAIQQKQIRITDHADEEAQADHLTFDEIFFSVLQGEIIEDYPPISPIQAVWYTVTVFEVNLFTVFGPIMQTRNGLY